MKTIIAIVGDSGSGKTTFANICESFFNIPPVTSHTTRPKRFPEEKCHVFIDDDQMDSMQNKIAETVYGGYKYAGVMQGDSDIYTYVIDLKGLEDLKKSEHKIISVLITCPFDVLIERVGEERVKRCKSEYKFKDFDYIYKNINKEYIFKTDSISLIKEILKNEIKN